MGRRLQSYVLIDQWGVLIMECEHCGMDIPDACGHPATPAPCWTAEQVALFEQYTAKQQLLMIQTAEEEAVDLLVAHSFLDIQAKVRSILRQYTVGMIEAESRQMEAGEWNR